MKRAGEPITMMTAYDDTFARAVDGVLRLFQHVRPTRALFGEKDDQQLTILRRLVEDFALGIDIEACPTVREDDGPASSSRNQCLSSDERKQAPELVRTLSMLAKRCSENGEAVESGTLDALARSGMERLAERGFEPGYIEFRDASTLGPAADGPLRFLAAARLGAARLIDNVVVSRQIRR